MSVYNTVVRNKTWYASHFPDRYRTVLEARDAFERLYPQFPEAACTDASRVLLELLGPSGTTIMIGRFTSKIHVWIYDTVACAHIDITLDQFPEARKMKLDRVFILRSNARNLSMSDVGYTTRELALFDEMWGTSGPFGPKFPLSRPVFSNNSVSLQNVTDLARRKLRRGAPPAH